MDELRRELANERRWFANLIAIRFAIHHNMPAAYQRASANLRRLA